jgi:hypothetical protein
MRRTLLAAGLGVAGIAIALVGCSSEVTGAVAAPPVSGARSVPPQHSSSDVSSPAAPRSSGARHATPTRTVTDLGATVRHNTQLTNSVHLNLTMQVPGVGIVTATGDAQFTGTLVAEQLTMTVPNVGNMHVVLVAGTIYLDVPPGTAGTKASPGKPWINVTAIKPGTSGQLQSLAQTSILATQADPAHLLQHIASAGTITTATHEQLDGVGTIHYAIKVDTAKLGRANPAQRQALTNLGVTSLPFAIWLNSANLPVRMVTVVPISAPAVTAGRQFSITVDYTHWGVPVVITAPPANEVTPLGDN